MKLDSDIKAKDNLIIKIQWSKGEVKDLLFEKEKEMKLLHYKIQDLNGDIDELHETIEFKK